MINTVETKHRSISSETPFNLHELMERLNGHANVVVQLVAMVTEKYEDSRRVLEQTIAAEMRDAASDIAHQLYGRYLMIGAAPAARVLLLLERAIHNSGRGIVNRLLNEFDIEHQRFLQAADEAILGISAVPS